MFEIFYKKNDNNKLFKYLEKSDFTNIQNYNPLYSRFLNHSTKRGIEFCFQL